MSVVNRRMRNRTSGSVGGRGPYPIGAGLESLGLLRYRRHIAGCGLPRPSPKGSVKNLVHLGFWVGCRSGSGCLYINIHCSWLQHVRVTEALREDWRLDVNDRPYGMHQNSSYSGHLRIMIMTTTFVNRMPGAFARLLREASQALNRNATAAAENLLDHALDLEPAHVEAHRLMGIAALMNGKHRKAVDHLRSAIAQCPNDASINMTLGSALVETDQIEEGLAYLKRACELAPDAAVVWCNLGVGLDFSGKINEASKAFEHAVAIEPTNIKARNKLADTLSLLGDAQAAADVLRETLRQRPGHVEAWTLLSNLKTVQLKHDDILQIRDLLNEPELPDDSRAALTFALAKALEDQSAYAESFDTVVHANALQQKIAPWSRSEERDYVDAVAHAFAGTLPDPINPVLGEEVIFIVSPPRSGSTLTEQIFASHPQVHGCGEQTRLLPAILDEESERRNQPFPHWVPDAASDDWQRLGEDYMQRIRAACGEHARYTDKTIDNWSAVGAIFAMLPGAHVVSVHRDPLETCLSCYKQYFPGGCNFTYDMDALVEYYADFKRLSELWRRQYPGHFFNSKYELLQQDPENQIRRLLDFCNLRFDPACLNFHQTRRAAMTISAAQVREPLRKDTARSKYYGDRLDPLRAKLDLAGLLVTNG